MFSVLLGCCLLVLDRENKLFFELFHLHSFVFLSWWLLSSRSVICEAKRKPREYTTRFLSNQSPYIFDHIVSTFQGLIFFPYIMFRVLVVLTSKDRETSVFSIYPEVEISTADYITQQFIFQHCLHDPNFSIFEVHPWIYLKLEFVQHLFSYGFLSK